MNLDDPRMTTFALGEMDALSATEVQEIEALLEADDGARRFVEETRQTAGLLRSGLALGEPLPALTAAQHQTIVAASSGMAIAGAPEALHATASAASASARIKAASHRSPAWARWALATAACAALATAVTWNVLNPNRTKPVATVEGSQSGVTVTGAPNTQPAGVGSTSPMGWSGNSPSFSLPAPGMAGNQPPAGGPTTPGTGVADEVRGTRWSYTPAPANQSGQQPGTAQLEGLQVSGANGKGLATEGEKLFYSGKPLDGTRLTSDANSLSLQGSHSYAGVTNLTGGTLGLNPIGTRTIDPKGGSTPPTGGGEIAMLTGEGRLGQAAGVVVLSDGLAATKAAPTGPAATPDPALPVDALRLQITGTPGAKVPVARPPVTAPTPEPTVLALVEPQPEAKAPLKTPALMQVRKQEIASVVVSQLREAEQADGRGDKAASETAMQNARVAIDVERNLLTAEELTKLEGALALTQAKLKVDPAKIADEQKRSREVATLVEKSQELIRQRHYKEALGALDQIAQLDPGNDYAKGAKPLVYDNFQLQEQRAFRERSTREFTNQMNSAETDARDAIARGDREQAISAINRAKQTVNGELAVYFDADELNQAKARIAQVENTLNNNESYARLNDNPFKVIAGEKAEPLSTFSIDVDTASYSNIRRFIDGGQLPPPDAVRIEEMLNYFPYTYEQPAKDSKEPFKAAVEVAACPWNANHRLARIAIKGRELAHDKRPVSNLVFLIDVSGSMNEPKKLPLVKAGLQMMVKELTENDRVALVVYAGAAGLVLPSTCADPMGKEKILAAIENLSAGGSTNGAHGIQLAYEVASSNFIKGGTNRVLVATDGDWNVGITDKTSLDQLIVDKAKSGVFLSLLGYGFGNLKDSTLESLANKGNGHYAYIDSAKESRKVLVEEMSGTLVNIAKDVKIQVEFNPAKVESYRLIGYENRMLRAEDFNNDKIDAGEIGAGHHVTALYEIVPADPKKPATPSTQPAKPEKGVDPLVYATKKSDDLLTLKLRYKEPEGDKSVRMEYPVADSGKSYAKASEDFKFAAAVAQFGMILRGSPHKGNSTLASVIELADEGKGKDEKGYRKEFVELARKAKDISKQK